MSNCKNERKLSKNTTWNEITDGGNICSPGNASDFPTGDWRSMKPIWLQEKCKQCLLCYPVCPDVSVIVDKTTGMMTGFDYEHCKGCGVCYKVCPFKAIDFVEEGK